MEAIRIVDYFILAIWAKSTWRAKEDIRIIEKKSAACIWLISINELIIQHIGKENKIYIRNDKGMWGYERKPIELPKIAGSFGNKGRKD